MEPNKLYYNGKEIDCEIKSCDYKNGYYYIEVLLFNDNLHKIYMKYEPGYKSELIFNGKKVMITDLNNPEWSELWELELLILPYEVIK